MSSVIAVKTKCPHCGYHDCFPLFSHNRCAGNCGQSYGAFPINKEEAVQKVKALLERVEDYNP